MEKQNTGQIAKTSREYRTLQQQLSRKRRQRSLAVLSLVLTAFVGWQIGSSFRQNQLADVRQSQRQEKLVQAMAAQILHPGLQQVFPYSVIPGGIKSVEQVKSVVAHDPVVAAHYADLDLSKAHFIRAEAARHVYVSYRIGNNIYWTSKKLTIKAGETLLTDGETTARGRCGNLLSDVAQKPVFSNEPSIKAFDTPEMQPPEMTIAERTLNAQPDFSEGFAYSPLDGPVHNAATATVPPIFYGTGAPGGGGNSTPPTTPPGTPVPEPTTELMLLSGFIAVGWLVRRAPKSVPATDQAPR